MTESGDAGLTPRAVQLASQLLERSRVERTRAQQRQQRRIARLLADPDGLRWVLSLTDEVLRIRDPERAAAHFASLASSVGGAPRFIGPFDRLALGAGSRLAPRLPRVVMPLVAARVRAELAGTVLPAEAGPLGRHIARRRDERINLNLNLLGEAVLGDREADRRLDAVLELLGRPDVNYVSVKISSICAQLNVAAFDREVARVSHQLRLLYDAARASTPPKFVNLDMEEYRDLQLTLAAFQGVLERPPYDSLDAGIVLQAYIPDSLPALRQLVAWARTRYKRGGGAVKVRIVKGANLAMERVTAELAGWEQAPFATKAEVDANFKRMLDVVLDPVNAGALRVGVASHNLFEQAWALCLAADRGLSRMVEAEMLEGMAGSSAAPVRDAAGGLLLYAPIVRRGDTESAIAYLVRRFDENTGPDNFLRHQFDLTVGSETWQAELDRFLASVAARAERPVPSRRTQNRSAEEKAVTPAGNGGPVPPFANEPDTDITVAVNRRWLAGWMQQAAAGAVLPAVVPAVVAGRRITSPASGEGVDPSRPEAVAYRWVQADRELVDSAVAAGCEAAAAWSARTLEERAAVLRAVADQLARRRGLLIATMAADGGKVWSEADAEVSEAVDYARYYAERALELDERFSPYGVVAVIPPWNFPLAIPAGGVLAALAAGNAVLLKPAPETVAVGLALAEACWDAGVPEDVLQLVPCADDDAGRRLVTHPDVDAVILTGAWDTARMFLGWRPSLALHAETSGKNAIVVTATADLDLAVADLVRSAFGHAGQKCSAASLAIVEAGVYDDPAFRRQLADAVRTLRPGPAWDLASTIGPLIRPPAGPLADALAHLDRGESWLVEPHQIAGNPHLWSPGVKLGVRPGSSFHVTECFGPVLGLMRARDLDQAIIWQNQQPFGLTAGIQALDPAEIARWLDRVAAGNLYVNRHITGAIVRRQPFGGWKRSVVGPGAKAGGPAYVAGLGRWAGAWAGSAVEFGAAVRRAWEQDLAPADPSGLAAEANVLRHRPLSRVLVRAGEGTPDWAVELAVAAGQALGIDVVVSSASSASSASGVSAEDDAWLAARVGGLPQTGFDKLRLLGAATDGLRLAAIDAGVWVDDTPVVGDPLVEARRWVREQAVSETLHRHGDVTGRYQPPLGPD
ncbi:MAG TPA: bifunctional proline dehydrogenase/L-glutamate gamma-semialdehyde dehydrogenase [Acidimicrobiales bacterium]|nr:bifunctional proline dehydrogenase/L-glutamate gamma-semialdehyde dehydrogenase [Acidimicrobiales bacterium]